MYTVLARKWRPQNFDQVCGQKHVSTTLKNAIEMQRVAHAYIFSGPRGVGKTSISRIFAKSLNCENGPTIMPCGNCSNCLEIAQGQNLDVIEIDGASNRRIDDIREIEEHVRFAPSNSTYKIYIIDEVHMLTKEAFNALLKTLEEPPAHVKFIFATTEPEKIPDTISSRCQKFEFKRLALSEIVDNLKMILNAEQMTFSEDVVFEIARAAEGSMRDAQSLLDQVISFCGNSIEKEQAELVLGTIGLDQIAQFTKAVSQGNLAQCLGEIKELVQNGKDIYRFTLALIQYMRDLIVLKCAGAEAKNLVDMTDLEREQGLQIAEQVALDKLMYMLSVLMQTEPRVKQSPSPRIPLEMAILKMGQIGDLQSLKQLVQAAQKKNDGIGPAQSVPPSAPVAQTAQPRRAPEVLSEDRPPSYQEQTAWQRVLGKIRQEKMTLIAMLQKAKLAHVKGESISLSYLAEDEFLAQNIEKNKEYIQEQMRRAGMNEILEVKCLQPEQKSDADLANVSGNINMQAVVNHKVVKSVLKAFEGKILDITRKD